MPSGVYKRVRQSGMLGRHHSEETKEKLRLAHLGKKNKPMTEYNKLKMSIARTGAKNPFYGKHHSDKVKEKISKSSIGRIISKETKQKISESKIGHLVDSVTRDKIRNKLLKPDSVDYVTIHNWVRSKLGTPNKCEHCQKDNLVGQQINWANVDHKYRRDLGDWMRLCAKCHIKYDRSRI